MQLWIPRITTWLIRFATIPRLTRAFGNLASPTWVRRRLFGAHMEMDLSRSFAQQLLWVEGERFVDERELVQSLLRPGMTAIDVGANIGYYLLMIEQRVGPSGKVILIEPSMENLPELRRNIALNGFTNVELHAVALGAEEGQTGMLAGINSGVVAGDDAPYTVPLRRLDRLVNEPVHFMKIDVEGYEGQALAGAREIIESQKPTLFLEVHPHIVRQFGFTTRGILDDLARVYPSIRLFEKKSTAHAGLLRKIADRYFTRTGTTEVADAESFVARYDDGKTDITYWAVCQA